MPTKKTAEQEPVPVCVNCGEPAAWRSVNPAVNEVYLCDRHGQDAGEGLEPL